MRFGTKRRIRLREENIVIKEDLPLSLPFSSIVCEGEHVLAESRNMHDKNVESSADAGEYEFQDTSLIVGFNDNFVKPFPYGFGILSTSSSIRIETYQELNKRTAGEPVETTAYKTTEGYNDISDVLYQPFANETDYALAMWFLEAENTKGEIDKYFKDHRLRPLHSHSSFKNADEWITLLHKIPHGILNDEWRTDVFQVNPIYVDQKPVQYSIKYRNVIGAL